MRLSRSGSSCPSGHSSFLPGRVESVGGCRRVTLPPLMSPTIPCESSLPDQTFIWSWDSSPSVMMPLRSPVVSTMMSSCSPQAVDPLGAKFRESVDYISTLPPVIEPPLSQHHDIKVSSWLQLVSFAVRNLLVLIEARPRAAIHQHDCA